MNNIFAFNRFKNLLLKDGKMYFRNYGITLTVFCCLPIIYWIISLVGLLADESTAIPVSEDARFLLICTGVVFVLMLAPSKVYGNANLSQEGVGFAMMPASSLEKFISMFIYCAIVTPVLVFFGGYLFDAFLSLFPFSGFMRPIHLHPLRVDAVERTSIYVGIIQFSAIFILGNMLFKRYKVLKTVGSVFVILFIILLVLFVIASIIPEQTPQQQYPESDPDSGNGGIVFLVFEIIVTALLLFFTYRKIKTQKY